MVHPPLLKIHKFITKILGISHNKIQNFVLNCEISSKDKVGKSQQYLEITVFYLGIPIQCIFNIADFFLFGNSHGKIVQN